MENNKKINNVQDLEKCPICGEKLEFYNSNITCANYKKTNFFNSHFWEDYMVGRDGNFDKSLGKYVGIRLIDGINIWGDMIIYYNNSFHVLGEMLFQKYGPCIWNLENFTKVKFENASFEEVHSKLKKIIMIS